MFSLKQSKNQGFTTLLNCQVLFLNTAQWILIVYPMLCGVAGWFCFVLLIIVLHVLSHVSCLTCMFKVPVKQSVGCWILWHSVSCKNRQQPITQNVHHASPQPPNRRLTDVDSPWTGLAAYRANGSYLHLAAVGAQGYYLSNKATNIYQSGDSVNYVGAVTGLQCRFFFWKPCRSPVHSCMCICSYK